MTGTIGAHALIKAWARAIGGGDAMIIDAWMQHPTERFLAHPMLESLRCWTGDALGERAIPVDTTLAAMEAGGVELALMSAWYGPEGWLVTHDEVAGFIAQAPHRFVGVGSVDISRPMEAVTSDQSGRARMA